jgi:hypothetical protein
LKDTYQNKGRIQSACKEAPKTTTGCLFDKKRKDKRFIEMRTKR